MREHARPHYQTPSPVLSNDSTRATIDCTPSQPPLSPQYTFSKTVCHFPVLQHVPTPQNLHRQETNSHTSVLQAQRTWSQSLQNKPHGALLSPRAVYSSLTPVPHS